MNEQRTGPAAEQRRPPHSRIWCRLRFRHDWHREVTEDGGRFRMCRTCGLVDDGTLNQMYDGWYMSNVRSTNDRDR
jgi:hypothetical protein